MTRKGAEGSMPRIFTLDSGPPTGVAGEAEGVGDVEFESKGRVAPRCGNFVHGVSAKGVPGDKNGGVISVSLKSCQKWKAWDCLQ